MLNGHQWLGQPFLSVDSLILVTFSCFFLKFFCSSFAVSSYERPPPPPLPPGPVVCLLPRRCQAWVGGGWVGEGKAWGTIGPRLALSGLASPGSFVRTFFPLLGNIEVPSALTRKVRSNGAAQKNERWKEKTGVLANVERFLFWPRTRSRPKTHDVNSEAFPAN